MDHEKEILPAVKGSRRKTLDPHISNQGFSGVQTKLPSKPDPSTSVCSPSMCKGLMLPVCVINC